MEEQKKRHQRRHHRRRGDEKKKEKAAADDMLITGGAGPLGNDVTGPRPVAKCNTEDALRIAAAQQRLSAND